MRELLKRSAIINAQNKYRRTPLHNAIRSGSLEVVQELLARGVSINVRDNVHQRTPLHYAVYIDAREMVKILIEKGADIDVEDGSKNAALRRALDSRSGSAVKELLLNGALCTKEDCALMGPFVHELSLGAIQANEEQVKKLTQTCALSQIQEALLYAIAQGNLSIVKCLVELVARRGEEAERLIEEGWRHVQLLLARMALIDKKKLNEKILRRRERYEEIQRLLSGAPVVPEADNLGIIDQGQNAFQLRIQSINFETNQH